MRPRCRQPCGTRAPDAGRGVIGRSVAAAEGDGLIDAVKRRDAAAVQTLVRGRADVNATEGDGTTALHWAVDADDLQMVTMLIKAGARATVANRLGVTPLVLAATNGSAAGARGVAEGGREPERRIRRRRNRAHGGGAQRQPRCRGRAAEGRRIGERDGRVARRDGPDVGRGREPWARGHAADRARRRQGRAARLLTFPSVRYNLATHGTIANPQGGFTALMFAARQGAVDSARALAEAGVDLNAQDPDGTPALNIAIGNGHTDVARLLVERGANPNVADNAGTTPLFAAVELHTTEMYPERKPRRTPGGAAGDTRPGSVAARQGCGP